MSHLPSLPSSSILTSTSGTNSSPGSLLLLPFNNPNPSSPQQTFKPYTSSLPHATAILPSNPTTNTDGLIVTAEEGKNLIYIHHLPIYSSSTSSSTTSSTTRLIAPEKISCLTLSPDGSLLVLGCLNGHSYLYELSNGKLLCSWESHFRTVTVLKFSNDGGVLASGGQDGRICLWSTIALVKEGQKKAYATLTSHLLSITDLCFSASVQFPNFGQLHSSSEDGTLKIWDIKTRNLLTNFNFSTSEVEMGPVKATVLDPSGRFAFVAVQYLQQQRQGGRVYRIDLYRNNHHSTSTEYEAVGGGGMENLEQIGKNSGNRGKKHYIELSATPISLSLTATTSHLLIGTTSSIQVVDTPSLQIIRSIPMDHPVNTLHLISINTTTSTGSVIKSEKKIIANQLSRIPFSDNWDNDDDDEEEEDDVYWVQIPHSSTSNTTSRNFLSSNNDARPPSVIYQSSPQSQSQPSSTSTQNSESSETIKLLKSQLQKANSWNTQMWKFIVDSRSSSASNDTSIPSDADEQEDSQEEIEDEVLVDEQAEEDKKQSSKKTQSSNSSNPVDKRRKRKR